MTKMINEIDIFEFNTSCLFFLFLNFQTVTSHKETIFIKHSF